MFHLQKTTVHIHRLLIAFLPLFTSKLIMYWFRKTFSLQNWMWTVDCGMLRCQTRKVNMQQPGKQWANSETLSKSLYDFPIMLNVPICFKTSSLLQHIQTASENRQNAEQVKNNNVTMLQFYIQHLYQFRWKDIKKEINVCQTYVLETTPEILK